MSWLRPLDPQLRKDVAPTGTAVSVREHPFSRPASNDRIWPEADYLLLVATYGEADTHYQIWVGSCDPLLPLGERLPNGVT
jgi:hypothetical protein